MEYSAAPTAGATAAPSAPTDCLHQTEAITVPRSHIHHTQICQVPQLSYRREPDGDGTTRTPRPGGSHTNHTRIRVNSCYLRDAPSWSRRGPSHTQAHTTVYQTKGTSRTCIHADMGLRLEDTRKVRRIGVRAHSLATPVPYTRASARRRRYRAKPRPRGPASQQARCATYASTQ